MGAVPLTIPCAVDIICTTLYHTITNNLDSWDSPGSEIAMGCPDPCICDIHMDIVATVSRSIVRVVQARPIIDAIKTPGQNRRGRKRHLHFIRDTRNYSHWCIWLNKQHLARMVLQHTFELFLCCSDCGESDATV